MINLHTEIVFNAYYNISLSENLKQKITKFTKHAYRKSH